MKPIPDLNAHRTRKDRFARLFALHQQARGGDTSQSQRSASEELSAQFSKSFQNAAVQSLTARPKR